MEEWKLYIDESGAFGADEPSPCVAGLCVRRRGALTAERRLRATLDGIAPWAAWPFHCTDWKQPALLVASAHCRPEGSIDGYDVASGFEAMEAAVRKKLGGDAEAWLKRLRNKASNRKRIHKDVLRTVNGAWESTDAESHGQAGRATRALEAQVHEAFAAVQVAADVLPVVAGEPYSGARSRAERDPYLGYIAPIVRRACQAIIRYRAGEESKFLIRVEVQKRDVAPRPEAGRIRGQQCAPVTVPDLRSTCASVFSLAKDEYEFEGATATLVVEKPVAFVGSNLSAWHVWADWLANGARKPLRTAKELEPVRQSVRARVGSCIGGADAPRVASIVSPSLGHRLWAQQAEAAW